MPDPIALCMDLFKSSEDSNGHQKITFTEYIGTLKELTIVDFLLGVFLVAFILGFIFSFVDSMKSYASSLIRLGFLGIIAFLTLKMTNQKLSADLCMTCTGINVMRYTRRIDVILSFCWTIVQTFIALVLNVMYYFVVLYMVYVLLRSHLIYDFGRTRNFEPDMRIFSLLHSKMEVNSLQELASAGIKIVFMMLYWLLIVVSVLSLIGTLVLVFNKPSLVAKFAELKLTGLVLLFAPFLATAVTLMMRYAYGRLNLSWVDKIIAHNVVPSISFTTMTSGFNFANPETFKCHAYVFANATINAILYSSLFLTPIKNTDICNKKGEINNTSHEFVDFKNRFLLGHYIIGILIIITYVAVLGGSIGKNTILGAIAIFMIIYIIAYVFMSKRNVDATDDNDE